MNISIFWFRRDLRLHDNTGLYKALSENPNVLPLFIFDESILDELPSDDPRVNFIYEQLEQINQELNPHHSSILIKKGKPLSVWKDLLNEYSIEKVYLNKDYEPYARERDEEIADLLAKNGIQFFSFKDQVIHEENEILKIDGSPYTVFTPYKNKWLAELKSINLSPKLNLDNLHKKIFDFPGKSLLGMNTSSIKVQAFNLKQLSAYSTTRDFPGIDTTSYLSPHLRFGTISIRALFKKVIDEYPVFASELIWREFFMQILFHFPHVVTENFKAKYDGIEWRNNEEEFKNWCEGKTGYPMVDAGMRQLNATGYMHNRVRMITAGFLCKHLLIDWKWGEAYFAKKLLDYELSSNNGNWQWSAGTGCDAAPYFRIFNPSEQQKKFDKNLTYIKRWIPEYGTPAYPSEMVEHTFARKRALEIYQIGLSKSN